MNWSDIAGAVGRAAPILGTLVGGPAGAAVGALIASGLGVANSPDAVQTALATNPDAAVKLAQIAKEREVELQQLLVQAESNRLANEAALEATAAADRASARAMQTSKPSPVPAILSIGITLGFFGILVAMLLWPDQAQDNSVVQIMVGSLGTAWATLMSYWFGSTRNSFEKTKLLAQSTPASTPEK